MTGFREFIKSSMNEAVDMSSRVDHTYDNNLQKNLAKRIYSWIDDEEDKDFSVLQKMVQNVLPKKQKVKCVRLSNNGSLLVIAV